MSLDIRKPADDGLARVHGDSGRGKEPTRALLAALETGARRIHLQINDEGMRLRSRVAGRLREVGHIPGELGRALAELLEETATDGVGTLRLDGGAQTVRYRLGSCLSADGKTLVLTLLPSIDDRDEGDAGDLSASDEIQSALESDIVSGKGLLLVAGPPGSGRMRTIEALAERCDQDVESLLVLTFGGPPPDGLDRHPRMELDLRDKIWALMQAVDSLDADRIILPEIENPLHATLAAALTGSRRLGIAPIHAQDACGALVKMREFSGDRHRAARDLLSVLAQHRLPKPCPACSTLRPLTAALVPEPGWDAASRRQLLAHAPLIRGRGSGCVRCHGTGYIGWSHIHEYVSVDDDVVDRLRSTDDAGRLREDLKALTVGCGLLDAAWREVLRGNVEPEEVCCIPGPEVAPFRLSRALFGEKPVAAEEPVILDTPVDEESLTEEEPAEPSAADAPDEPRDLYSDAYDILAGAVSKIRSGTHVDPEPLESLAEKISRAAETNLDLVQKALTGGTGDDLVSHQLNVAILAARIGIGLQWHNAEPMRFALASLLHDIGLARVPRQMLKKTKKLSAKENALRKRHAEWTEEMVESSLPRLSWLPRVVRQVHERETGTGYPDGLTGDRIDPLAKVIGLADVLESLTHPRPWRAAVMTFDAIQLLMKEHAGEFDARAFRAMARQISLFPVGSLVRLNNGSIGRVTSINPDNFYRPMVELMWDAAGREIANGRGVDLSDSPFLYIASPIREEAVAEVRQGARR